jgi:hypothetical protein
MSVTINGSGSVVLQTVNIAINPFYSISSTSYVPIQGLQAGITPSSTSSKILIIANCFPEIGTNNAIGSYVQLQRFVGGTQTGLTNTTQAQYINTNDYNVCTQPGFICYLDSPATTSPILYAVYLKLFNTTMTYVYPQSFSSSGSQNTIQLMEISGV